MYEFTGLYTQLCSFLNILLHITFKSSYAILVLLMYTCDDISNEEHFLMLPFRPSSTDVAQSQVSLVYKICSYKHGTVVNKRLENISNINLEKKNILLLSPYRMRAQLSNCDRFGSKMNHLVGQI